MGALFVRSQKGRGGTSHSKGLQARCAGGAGRRPAAGVSAGRADPEAGGAELAAAGSWTPRAALPR